MKAFPAIFGALAFFSAGCSSLPPGEPPTGNIVCNECRFRSEEDVAEYLATRLSLFLLEKHPGKPLALYADPGAARVARTALKECVELAGCRVVADAPLRLCGKTVDGGWDFALCEEKSVLWRETCSLEEKR
ncbi:MAG: hypothetical protein MJ016_00405 [Victivallaceae bacterium]|nr:hypothetical protein [Victivallaceae bacterium]